MLGEGLGLERAVASPQRGCQVPSQPRWPRRVSPAEGGLAARGRVVLRGVDPCIPFPTSQSSSQLVFSPSFSNWRQHQGKLHCLSILRPWEEATGWAVAFSFDIHGLLYETCSVEKARPRWGRCWPSSRLSLAPMAPGVALGQRERPAAWPVASVAEALGSKVGGEGRESGQCCVLGRGVLCPTHPCVCERLRAEPRSEPRAWLVQCFEAAGALSPVGHTE